MRGCTDARRGLGRVKRGAEGACGAGPRDPAGCDPIGGGRLGRARAGRAAGGTLETGSVGRWGVEGWRNDGGGSTVYGPPARSSRVPSAVGYGKLRLGADMGTCLALFLAEG